MKPSNPWSDYRKRRRSAWAMLLLTVLLASCDGMHATKPELPPPPPKPTVDPACAAFDLIAVSVDDVLTDGTARQILLHNETWASLCGPK